MAPQVASTFDLTAASYSWRASVRSGTVTAVARWPQCRNASSKRISRPLTDAISCPVDCGPTRLGSARPDRPGPALMLTVSYRQRSTRCNSHACNFSYRIPWPQRSRYREIGRMYGQLRVKTASVEAVQSPRRDADITHNKLAARVMTSVAAVAAAAVLNSWRIVHNLGSTKAFLWNLAQSVHVLRWS